MQGDGAAELAIQKAIDDINFALRQKKNGDRKSERPKSSGSTYGQFSCIFCVCNCCIALFVQYLSRVFFAHIF